MHPGLEQIMEQFPDWEADDDGAVFTCPHGDRIEPDGECPEGCQSPLIQMGFM